MALAAIQPAPRWELYRLLSDPTRLRLLALTSKHELAVGELAELLREGQSKISRHAAALRDAGMLYARKQGTWVLLRLAPDAAQDTVVADALAAGLELCDGDGSLTRVEAVIATRDEDTREFFARGGRALRSGPPEELAAYLRALSPLLESRDLAIDAGTGDGSLLEVLAPVFERVIAIDRSEAQLDLARERATRRAFSNVCFVHGELDSTEVQQAVRGKRKRCDGADAVFAARVLHHAAVPERAMGQLVQLARPADKGRAGGVVVVLDYEAHDDEQLREQQADLWLGFARDELREMAESAGLSGIDHARLPAPWCGDGPDRHLTWQLLSGRRS